MSFPDPRTRGRIKMDDGAEAARIPTDLVLGQVLTKALLASAALLARHWLLTGHNESAHQGGVGVGGGGPGIGGANMVSDGSISVWAVATVVFVLAALIQGVWLRTWTWVESLRRADAKLGRLLPKLGGLAVTLFLTMMVWLMALERLPALNVLLFTQYCEVWAGDLLRSRRGATLMVLVALGCSFLFTVARGVSTPKTSIDHDSLFRDQDDEELPPSPRRARPSGLASPSVLRAADANANAALFTPSAAFIGHVLLLVYALLTIEKERSTLNAAGLVGGRRRAQVIASTLIAAVTLPLGIVGRIVGLPTLPPLQSLAPDLFTSTQHGVRSGHLAAYLLVALAVVLLEPLITTALEPHGTPKTRVLQGWLLCFGSAIAIGYVGFGVRSPWYEDVVLGAIVYAALATTLSAPSDQRQHQRSGSDASAVAGLAASIRHMASSSQSLVHTILSNPKSRPIFQFLCLNLAFMVVQLLWGVWTNSLGLISDAIHMFFDCAAIGMGLSASVMATWKTGGRFSYGYSRVETLSGFANGVFLILISIFIVFEAIQRIVEPPEMHNTLQLLLVSSAGLAVNLFGMFAMGGHHHHGHGHSHDHDHDHGHSHNMMGVYLHVMADTLGSVGVIISTLLIKQFGWTGFDPIASLFIAVLIVASVIPLVLDAGRILCLDMGPERGQEVASALGQITALEGIASYSSPRFWPKDAETLVGSIVSPHSHQLEVSY